MEKDGDVMTEFPTLSSQSHQLGRCSFNIGNAKMCKDDVTKSIFSNTPAISKNLDDDIMIIDTPSNPYPRKVRPKRILGITNRKNFYSKQNHSESDMNKCLLPMWGKTPSLCDLSSSHKNNPYDSTIEYSFQKNKISNGDREVVSTPNNFFKVASCYAVSDSNKMLCSDSSSDITQDNLTSYYEADTSSSSVEKFYSPVPSKHKLIIKNDCKSNTIQKGQNKKPDLKLMIDICKPQEKSDNRDKTINQNQNLQHNRKFPMKIVQVSEIKANIKVKTEPLLSNSERMMPQLIPLCSETLICIDDDEPEDPICVKNKEVIDVASSPEMPTLIPFTSENEEPLRVKAECVSDYDETSMLKDTADSEDCANEKLQPQVVLRRISLANCLPLFKDENELENIQQSQFRHVRLKVKDSCDKLNKSITGGPDIDVIDGLNFFSFGSKQEMEHYIKKDCNDLFTGIEIDDLKDDSIDVGMIVPTKTTDITQIKGWRNKYFAPESQFHPLKIEHNGVKLDEISSDSKTFENSGNELKSPLPMEECKEKLSETSSVPIPPQTVEIGRVDLPKKDDPRSAFVSDALDQFLKVSSELNVSLLEKINPNIKPICPDASILSLGKLRKYEVGLKFSLLKRKSFNAYKFKTDKLETNDNVTKIDNSVVICSSDEDIPVAQLIKRKRKSLDKPKVEKTPKKLRSSRPQDPTSQRLVLRLKKEVSGNSDGYKVADISSEKYDGDIDDDDEEEEEEEDDDDNNNNNNDGVDREDNYEESSSNDSEEDVLDMFKFKNKGLLPVIKQTLFGKRDEPRILDEFIDNLNMLGTRKDVAMLVQSNQSYFNHAPIIVKSHAVKSLTMLISNKNFMALKVRHNSKKKIKAWEKYLPKNLGDTQKMKFAIKYFKKKKSDVIDGTDNIMANQSKGKVPSKSRTQSLNSGLVAEKIPRKSRKRTQDSPDIIKIQKHITFTGKTASLEDSSLQSSAITSASKSCSSLPCARATVYMKSGKEFSHMRPLKGTGVSVPKIEPIGEKSKQNVNSLAEQYNKEQSLSKPFLGDIKSEIKIHCDTKGISNDLTSPNSGAPDRQKRSLIPKNISEASRSIQLDIPPMDMKKLNVNSSTNPVLNSNNVINVQTNTELPVMDSSSEKNHDRSPQVTNILNSNLSNNSLTQNANFTEMSIDSNKSSKILNVPTSGAPNKYFSFLLVPVKSPIKGSSSIPFNSNVHILPKPITPVKGDTNFGITLPENSSSVKSPIVIQNLISDKCKPSSNIPSEAIDLRLENSESMKFLPFSNPPVSICPGQNQTNATKYALSPYLSQPISQHSVPNTNPVTFKLQTSTFL